MRTRAVLSTTTALAALCLAAPAFAESAPDTTPSQVAFNNPQPASGTEDHPIPVLLPASASTVVVSFQVGAAYGRTFSDQEFKLTSYPVVEANINVTLPSGFYANYWTAQSLVGRYQDHENDYTLGKVSKVGTWTVDAQVAHFEFGAHDWQGKVDFTHALSKSCNGTLTAIILRGSLNDEVYRAQASCTRGRLDFTVMAATERTFNATGIEYSVGYKVFRTLPFRVFVKGYAGTRGIDAIYGIDLYHAQF